MTSILVRKTTHVDKEEKLKGLLNSTTTIKIKLLSSPRMIVSAKEMSATFKQPILNATVKQMIIPSVQSAVATKTETELKNKKTARKKL